MQNVRIEDGALRVRYGYKAFSQEQPNLNELHGFVYLQGYTSANALVEEYLTFEDISGTVKPYMVHVTTGVRTEVTNGGVAVSLAQGYWNGISFRDRAYLFNESASNSVVRHTLGDDESWTALRIPVSPTAAPTYAVSYGTEDAPYTRLSFGTLSNASIAGTGAYTDTNSGTNLNDLAIGHLASTTGLTSFTVDLDGAGGPGQQNWTYNDIHMFHLWSVSLQIAGLTVSLLNAAGEEFVMKSLQQVATSRGVSFRVDWRKEDRTKWDDIKQIKCTYTVIGSSATAADNTMYMTQWHVGGVNLTNSRGDYLPFSYTYYSSTLDFESGVSPTLLVPQQALEGYVPDGIFGLQPLGTHLEITGVASADANVDTVRLYVYTLNEGDNGWRRVVSQSDADLSMDYKLTWEEAGNLTKYEPTEFTSSKVKCACVHHGHVVWGHQGGFQNIRYSRKGTPEEQYKDGALYDDTDDTVPWTFSLAANFADDPIWIFSIGDVVIAGGTNGVYAQVGKVPRYMTPMKKVGDAPGARNQFAACLWMDDFGNPGVAYVDKSREGIWFVRVDESFDGEQGFSVHELTETVRGKLLPYLFTEQTDFTGLTAPDFRMVADRAQNALWCVFGRRAMVLRRRSQADGFRVWEPYEYTTSGNGVYIAYLTYCDRYRLRFFLRNGEIHDFEYSNSDSAYITGANADSTQARPSIYWTSKTFAGDNRRIDRVDIVRDSLSDRPTLQVVSDRQTTSKQVAASTRHVRFGFKQQGWEHKFKLTLEDASGPVRRLAIHEIGPLSGRPLS